MSDRQTRTHAPTKLGISLHELDEKMNTEDLISWLQKQLHRIPEAADLYHAGKLLYQTGAYGAAAKLLQRYVSGSGSELPGFHLLAYAYHMIGHPHDSRDCLLKCVNNGFDSDWQLLVEIQWDLDHPTITPTQHIIPQPIIIPTTQTIAPISPTSASTSTDPSATWSPSAAIRTAARTTAAASLSPTSPKSLRMTPLSITARHP